MSKIFTSAVILLMIFAISPVLAQDKKAKVEKLAGDVGLLDLEKNYMIIVTKEGKLVTIDFDQKTKVTRFVPEKAKMVDIGLGQAASVSYMKKGDKNILDSVEFPVKAKK